MIRAIRLWQRPHAFGLVSSAACRQLSSSVAAAAGSVESRRPASSLAGTCQQRPAKLPAMPGLSIDLHVSGGRSYSVEATSLPAGDAATEPGVLAGDGCPSITGLEGRRSASSGEVAEDVPFIKMLLRQTPDPLKAQERLEEWAKSVFAMAEDDARAQREERGQASPNTYAHISTDSQFRRFVMDWTCKIQSCLDSRGRNGLTKSSQRILNHEYHGTQLLTNEDIARITVGVLLEQLIQICTRPNASTTAAGFNTIRPENADTAREAQKESRAAIGGIRSVAAATASVEVESALEASEDAAEEAPEMVEDSEATGPIHSHDILLVTVAEAIGEAVQRELKMRLQGRLQGKVDKRAGMPAGKKHFGAISPSIVPKLTPREKVHVGGDLLYLSQEHELILPGRTTPIVPWTKVYVTVPKRMARGPWKAFSVLRFQPNLLALSSVVDELKVGHRNMPMIIKPLPATRTENGGYLTLERRFISAPKSLARKLAISEARESGDMDDMLSALNYLSETPWLPSDVILDDLKRLWPNTQQSPLTMRGRKKELRGLLRLTDEDKVTVDLARAYRGTPFYNFVRPDYRGRVYPHAIEFSTVGNDLSRSLLQFNLAKPLGAVGWRQLKLHLASLYEATKRASFDERLQWVDEHWDDILDSGTKGLDGDRWFERGGHPWQVRATCAEIARAAAHPGGPELYESRLPIHQDGSCNGLQHYAALARDVEGGSAVNLLPAERPADVYSQVLERVVERVQSDAKSGKSLSAEIVLKHGDKLLVRDLVKRTVMTRVYGLTVEGSRRHAVEFLQKLNLFDQLGMSTARYLSSTTLASIEGLFPRATAIQNWLLTCCKLILKSENVDEQGDYVGEGDISMSWTTPLGFPVVQDIRKFDTKSVVTLAGRITIMEPGVGANVQGRKESDAFAPNFIHSLDAAHLFRTAHNAELNGLTMGTVHDSFWTHAADIDTLREITRLTFITQYESHDVLEALRDELIKRYGENLIERKIMKYFKKKHRIAYELMPLTEGVPRPELDAWGKWGSVPATKDGLLKNNLPPCPSSGTLDIGLVRHSDYFFH